MCSAAVAPKKNKNVARHKDRVSNDGGIHWHSRRCNLLDNHIFQKKLNPPLSPPKKKKRKKENKKERQKERKKHPH